MKSFRTQVFVDPQADENHSLQRSLEIAHDETTNRIFLIYDEMICFLCKKNRTHRSKMPQHVDNTFQEYDTEIIAVNAVIQSTLNSPSTADATTAPEIEEINTTSKEKL